MAAKASSSGGGRSAPMTRVSYGPRGGFYSAAASPAMAPQNYMPGPAYAPKTRNQDVLGSLADYGVNVTITDKVAILDPSLRNGTIYAQFDPVNKAIYKNRMALNQLKRFPWLNAPVEEQMIGNHEAGHALAFSIYDQAKKEAANDPLKTYLADVFGPEAEKQRHYDALAKKMRKEYDVASLEGATQLFARATTKDSYLRGIYEAEVYKARKEIARELAAQEDSTGDAIKELRKFDATFGYNEWSSLKKGELEQEYNQIRMDIALTPEDSAETFHIDTSYQIPFTDVESFIIPETSFRGGGKKPDFDLPYEDEERKDEAVGPVIAPGYGDATATYEPSTPTAFTHVSLPADTKAQEELFEEARTFDPGKPAEREEPHNEPINHDDED